MNLLDVLMPPGDPPTAEEEEKDVAREAVSLALAERHEKALRELRELGIAWAQAERSLVASEALAYVVKGFEALGQIRSGVMQDRAQRERQKRFAAAQATQAKEAEAVQ